MRRAAGVRHGAGRGAQFWAVGQGQRRVAVHRGEPPAGQLGGERNAPEPDRGVGQMLTQFVELTLAEGTE